MLFQAQTSKEKHPVAELPSSNNNGDLDGGGVRVSCYSEAINDVPVHFQIISLSKQIYVWIGCSSAKFGNLYAAAPTRPNNTFNRVRDYLNFKRVDQDVLKTGLNIILASNIPKNSPMIEVAAEKMLVQKLASLGFIRPKSEGKGHLDNGFIRSESAEGDN
ncbi:uncharacterized protein LOC111447543 isoform X2 [Cucurbita moschata]|uniref:Uncharacterized protein LOC111447543 isoform X2 n=1 Tax=Cucurbita moschata TaxID=3662 RepID=A0A6J1FVR0_CUCMO|nr:uncharacterized protein LOC111447543 isoform X2 [Cucurbita moschata]